MGTNEAISTIAGDRTIRLKTKSIMAVNNPDDKNRMVFVSINTKVGETRIIEEKIKILNKSLFTVNCSDDKNLLGLQPRFVQRKTL